ncbi:MAG TPA: TIGR03067 domain-containing protein [Gemmataceae bacterium]|jgi:uncharacterized protein (TIGR03067 family)|nr:TIGR03067 domain-containing protein [Gemmataceae bacterium]
MSWLRTLVLGVGLVAVSAAAAQDDKKESKLDPAKLVGAYKLADGKKAGEKLGDDAKKGSVVITKDTIALKGADGTEFEFSYKLDAKANPAEIDMEITKPEALKGAKTMGIIALEGGEVKLCYHPEGKERPKKFESTKDNGYFLMTMKKDQPKGADKPGAAKD